MIAFNGREKWVETLRHRRQTPESLRYFNRHFAIIRYFILKKTILRFKLLHLSENNKQKYLLSLV